MTHGRPARRLAEIEGGQASALNEDLVQRAVSRQPVRRDLDEVLQARVLQLVPLGLRPPVDQIVAHEGACHLTAQVARMLARVTNLLALSTAQRSHPLAGPFFTALAAAEGVG